MVALFFFAATGPPLIDPCAIWFASIFSVEKSLEVGSIRRLSSLDSGHANLKGLLARN